MISMRRVSLFREYEIITEHDAEVPDVKELVKLENESAAAD
jgi:hypothetical protein